MTCPKCGAKLQETSLVCLNCKTFVLPNIPRKTEAAQPVVPEVKPGIDVFKNLMNFVQAETPPGETADQPQSGGSYQPRENGAGHNAGPDINLRQFGSGERDSAPPRAGRKPRIQRFGSEDVDFVEEEAPAADTVPHGPDRDQPDTDASSPEHAEPPRTRNRQLIVGGISAVVFIALVIVFYLYVYNQP